MQPPGHAHMNTLAHAFQADPSRHRGESSCNISHHGEAEVGADGVEEGEAAALERVPQRLHGPAHGAAGP
jgi:hypothetical protein